MKNCVQHIFECLLTIILALVLVQKTGYLLDPKWTQGGLDVISAFDSLEDNSIEIIIYGSSHAQTGCDTRVMCDKYGLKAYNYGYNWQAINTTLLFLEDSLRSQLPKVVCIELFYVGNIKQNTDMDGQIYYTRAIKDFEGKRAYLKQCFGNDLERYVSYYFPLIMFHDNWTEIISENYSLPNPEKWINSKGYYSFATVTPFTLPDPSKFSQLDLKANCVEVLHKMVKLCKDKDINIVFYTNPYIGEYHYNDVMTKFAKENGCAYLNLFNYIDDIGLSGETDFRDAGHLNDSGAGKVASFLAEYIIEHYDVEHSGPSVVSNGGV